MVKLTDAHAEALAFVGTGALTFEQVESVLDVFSAVSHSTSGYRFYLTGTLDEASVSYHAFVDDKCITLSTTIGQDQSSIESIVRGFLWGGITEVFDIKLVVVLPDFELDVEGQQHLGRIPLPPQSDALRGHRLGNQPRFGGAF